MMRKASGVAVLLGALLLSSCAPAKPARVDTPSGGSASAPKPADASPGTQPRKAETAQEARLIPARDGISRAREYPRHPDRDLLPKDAKLAEQIKLGFRIFTETGRYAPKYVSNQLTCQNCHLNAGQREGALPLVGIANLFPEYNKRAGRLFSLEDRIVGCFLRSMNGANAPGPGERHENSASEIAPSPRSPEVLAVSAYLTWLSQGLPSGEKPAWRGRNKISDEEKIPVSDLDPRRGRELYEAKCAACHGRDGAGVQLPNGLKPGPLWGAASWNDGAGMARVYTLAGYIRYAMPYDAPGSLTAEEAQQIAAYIDAHDRPAFAHKDRDYTVEKLPKDAVYYERLYPKNPLAAKLQP